MGGCVYQEWRSSFESTSCHIQWITGPESIALLDGFFADSRSQFNSALRCSLIAKTDLIAARRSPLQALIISSINESSVGIPAPHFDCHHKLTNKEIWAIVRSTPQSTGARRRAREQAGVRARGHSHDDAASSEARLVGKICLGFQRMTSVSCVSWSAAVLDG